MPTMRIVASSYQLSNTSYTNIADAANMYTNTDSTTYATFNHTRTQTTSYYLYVRGFDFSQIPSNATVTNVTVKVKASVSGAGSYTPGLYNNTSSLSKSFNGSIGTSATTRTVDITSNWETYKGYGTNLTIRLQLNRSSRNTASKMLIYGAEVAVEYTLPIERTINTSATGCTITPSGTTVVYDGDSFTCKIEGSRKPTVTDNGVDVTDSVVEGSSDVGYTVESVSGASYGFSLNSNGYYESENYHKASSAAVAKVSFNLPVPCGVVFKVINYGEATYDYGLLSNIDTTFATSATADTSNVFWSGKNNNSANVQTIDYGTVSSGSHFVYTKYYKDSYTDSNNDTLQFKVEITPTEPISGDVFWTYTIVANGDHTIVAVLGEITEQFYIKENGSWKTINVTACYKKVNGSWVLQNNWSTLFDTTKNYVKG